MVGEMTTAIEPSRRDVAGRQNDRSGRTRGLVKGGRTHPLKTGMAQSAERFEIFTSGSGFINFRIR